MHTALTKSKTQGILKNIMNPPAWNIDIGFERFLMKRNRGIAEKMFKEDYTDDKTMYELYRIY